MNTFADVINFADNENSDYCYALLHLAYFKGNDRYQLIWGMAELIPEELKDDSFWKEAEVTESFSNKNTYYWFLRKLITKEDVINIYNGIKANNVITLKFGNDKIEINLKNSEESSIYEEPAPENLLSTVKDNSDFYMPFVANHWGAVRVKGFISNKDNYIKTIVDDSNVIEAYKRYFQWNLNKYAELLGSFWFVLPNPLFRDIATRMLPPEKDKPDTVQVIVQPRNNKKLDTLTLKCFERRDFGYISFKEAKFDKYGIATVPISCNCEAISINICCNERGLIYYEPFEYFLKSINIPLNLVNTELKTNIVDNILTETYESQIYEKVKDIVINSPNKETRYIPSGESVKFHHNKKNQMKKASEMGQKLFINGNKKNAENYIRDLISKAENQVVIIDPYFASPEFIKYPLAISLSSVKVTVLTSNSYLEKYNGSRLKKKTEKSNKELLLELICSQDFEDFKKKTGLENNFEVLATKDIVIHDRFLVIDKEVYFSGNSLNNIGKKMSMMIKLPDPDDVLKNIEPYLDINNPDVEKIV